MPEKGEVLSGSGVVERNGKPQTASPWTIILAGGEGRRLAHLVRLLHDDDRPKQFATIIGTRSMLQHTYERALRHSPPEKILVVITDGQQGWAAEQLPAMPEWNFLVQPRNLDTGPAICLALAHVMARDPQAAVLLFPSDHFVFPEKAFEKQLSHVLSMIEELEGKKSILLGTSPSSPSGEMGWILPGGVPWKERPSMLLEIRGFIEKPQPHVAEKLHDIGALWNTFILAGKAHHLWYLLWKQKPDVASWADRFCPRCTRESWDYGFGEVFEQVSPFSFSSQVLEREAAEFLVARLENVQWSDWGAPGRVFQSIHAMGWEKRFTEKMSGLAISTAS